MPHHHKLLIKFTLNNLLNKTCKLSKFIHSVLRRKLAHTLTEYGPLSIVNTVDLLIGFVTDNSVAVGHTTEVIHHALHVVQCDTIFFIHVCPQGATNKSDIINLFDFIVQQVNIETCLTLTYS